jgi:hypothetical protein
MIFLHQASERIIQSLVRPRWRNPLAATVSRFTAGTQTGHFVMAVTTESVRPPPVPRPFREALRDFSGAVGAISVRVGPCLRRAAEPDNNAPQLGQACHAPAGQAAQGWRREKGASVCGHDGAPGAAASPPPPHRSGGAPSEEVVQNGQKFNAAGMNGVAAFRDPLAGDRGRDVGSALALEWN